MASTETLERRARLAYERGRWAWAFRWSAGAASLAALTLYGCPHQPSALACIAGLGAGLAVCLVRGGTAAAGARLGLVAGLGPCLLPALMRWSGYCTMAGNDLSAFACAAGGLLAGVTLGGGVAPGRPREFWIAAGGILLLAGGVGCLPVGLLGMAGLAIGTAVGALPGLVRRLA